MRAARHRLRRSDVERADIEEQVDRVLTAIHDENARSATLAAGSNGRAEALRAACWTVDAGAASPSSVVATATTSCGVATSSAEDADPRRLLARPAGAAAGGVSVTTRKGSR